MERELIINELDYVLIHENEYAYKVDAKDEDLEYTFYCKDLEVEK
ncbi:hypothetical protein [Aliarcobacter butzleri]|nr:hypothetical protein [Aliarcobacter butzleri]MCT7572445.1 hypothetical protein [Aliarcobacter butzleri]MCT7647417.1 hypothetical protein [Aliarcobacter butzleri]